MKHSFKIFSIAAVATMALMMSGCQDFLTIYPTDKVVLENYWKNKNDVETMVANSYRKMAENDFITRLLVWGELRSDDVCEGSNLGTELKYINDANLLPTNSYCSWEIFYSAINNCNIVMKFAPMVLEEDPDFTQGDMDVIRGEMLAIRALCHFYLVRTFRDIPLLKEAMVDDTQDLFQDQVPPLEALDFILEDLYEAEGLVMTSGAYADLNYNKGRITADAVRAMIADVMLWKAAFTQYKNKSDGSDCYEYYTTCINYCERIINDRNNYIEEYEKKNNNGRVTSGTEGAGNPSVIGYPLNTYPQMMGMSSDTDPYSSLFGEDQNDLKESIFEIQGNINNNPHYATNQLYGYQNNAALFNATSLLGGQGTDINLYKKTDLRRYSYTKEGGEEDVYNVAKYTQTNVNYTTTSNPPYKTSYTPRQTNSDGSSATNWIVYRITDVMLMEAEALALRNDTTLGDEAKAFKLVKATYYRSNPPAVKVARADSINLNNGIVPLVRDERQRELCFEGKRWYDLVRWALREGSTTSMLNELVSHKYETNQNAVKSKMANIDKLFFPISESQIKTSNGHLKQNPSYNTEDVYQKN